MSATTPSAEDKRLAEKTWDFWSGQHAEVVAWLVRLGCTVVTRREAGQTTEYLIDGIVGPVRVGLLFPAGDPVNLAACIGFLVAGQLWPVAYPTFMDLVSARWKASRSATQKGTPT